MLRRCVNRPFLAAFPVRNLRTNLWGGQRALLSTSAENTGGERDPMQTQIPKEDLAELAYVDFDAKEYSPELTARFESLHTPEIEMKKIKSPIFLPGRSGKIAAALFETATGAGELDKVRDEVKKLQEKLKEPEFEQFIHYYVEHDRHEQHEYFDKILEGYSLILQRTIALDLIEDKAVHLFKKVLANFDEIVKTYYNEIDVEICFHEEPSDTKLERVVGETMLHLPDNVRPKFTCKVKPALLKGYTISAGEYYNVDRSLLADRTAFETRYNNLVEAIKQSFVASLAKFEPVEMPARQDGPPATKETNAKALADARKFQTENQQAIWRSQFVDWV